MKNNSKAKKVVKSTTSSISNANQLTQGLMKVFQGVSSGTIDGKTATTLTKVANTTISNVRNQISYLKAIGSKKKIKFLS